MTRLVDRGPSSDDLIREAKAWAEPPPAAAPPRPEPRGAEPEPLYPSDRIATRHPIPTVDPVDAAGVPHGERRGTGTGIRFGLVVLVAGLAIGGYFAYRAATKPDPVEIFSVTSGTCFMDPPGATVAEVEVVPCTDSHDLEAFALVTLPYAPGATMPGDDELFGAAYDECLVHFESYTGEPYESSRWYLDAFVPDRRHWKSGGRDALCVLFLADAEGMLVPATESARA